MKTFEIQRHDKGKWVHDSYFDDDDQAVSQAKQMVQSGRHDGVRVVEDEFSDDSALSRAKILFLSRPSDFAANPKTQKQKRTASGRRPPPQEIDRPHRQHRPKAKQKRASSVYGIVGTLFALVVIGLAAHYGLQTAFQ